MGFATSNDNYRAYDVRSTSLDIIHVASKFISRKGCVLQTATVQTWKETEHVRYDE